MKRLVVALLFVSGTMLGCAQNYFNIPAENFAEKVKVLGVAPIIIDADSDITHPQKEFLIQLITDLNRKYEPLLVRKLQSSGSFYAVTPLADDPRQLFSSLLSRREKRDDANIKYNKYFWKNDELGAYIKKNRLDAVMIVVVSGLTQTGKIYSSNLLASLETDYNYLMMSAQILGPDGTVLWEYPNFRSRLLTYSPLVNLQYPDFSESDANLSRKTEVRFKSLDGIRRTLEQKKSDWLLRETQEPEVYGKLFDEMASLLKPTADKPATGGTIDSKPVPPQAQPLKAVDPPEVSAPARPASAPENIVKTPGSSPPASNEIVPATESTR